MTDINLTDNEVAVIKNILNFEYMDDGIEQDGVWADSFANDVATFCNVPAASAGGIMASLANKGFIEVGTEAVWLTDLLREYHAKLNS